MNVFSYEQNELAMATQATDCMRIHCSLLPPVVQRVTTQHTKRKEWVL